MYFQILKLYELYKQKQKIKYLLLCFFLSVTIYCLVRGVLNLFSDNVIDPLNYSDKESLKDNSEEQNFDTAPLWVIRYHPLIIGLLSTDSEIGHLVHKASDAFRDQIRFEIMLYSSNGNAECYARRLAEDEIADAVPKDWRHSMRLLVSERLISINKFVNYHYLEILRKHRGDYKLMIADGLFTEEEFKYYLREAVEVEIMHIHNDLANHITKLKIYLSNQTHQQLDDRNYELDNYHNRPRIRDTRYNAELLIEILDRYTNRIHTRRFLEDTITMRFGIILHPPNSMLMAGEPPEPPSREILEALATKKSTYENYKKGPIRVISDASNMLVNKESEINRESEDQALKVEDIQNAINGFTGKANELAKESNELAKEPNELAKECNEQKIEPKDYAEFSVFEYYTDDDSDSEKDTFKKVGLKYTFKEDVQHFKKFQAIKLKFADEENNSDNIHFEFNEDEDNKYKSPGRVRTAYSLANKIFKIDKKK